MGTPRPRRYAKWGNRVKQHFVVLTLTRPLPFSSSLPPGVHVIPYSKDFALPREAAFAPTGARAPGMELQPHKW